ncbi:T9SS type A sorting domain-containing protein [Pontibacter sp. G13]|uniref:T9SS type A sorting domain-containing protein n=1 Tax=Pontibacter sp. G13 TaxID=3074898 RepID=UPI00288946F8|nr:T9SS type A sorting domain-containing protein [Pontibacter sp. G13]WNJ16123.1 T9SS type A sorting domain-containing protein [Pontibacter sp. G13]
MKKNLYAFFFLISFVWALNPVLAQYEWKNLGPDNFGGLVRSLAFDPSGNLLAGIQGGGLWTSSDEGLSWQRVESFDSYSRFNPNITSIAVDGNDIYVATGATRFYKPFAQTGLNRPATYDYREDAGTSKGNLDGLPGAGVFVSRDGGQTWSNENATAQGGTLNYSGPFTDIQKVFVASGKVFIATAEGLYVANDKNLGSVELVNGPDFLRENVVFDIEEAANNTIFVSAHQDGNIETDSLFISTDGGNTFETVLDDAIFGGGGQALGFNRTEIAVSPSDNNIVYVAGTQASGEINGIYRLDMSTNEWTVVGPKGSAEFPPLSNGGRDAFVMSVFPDNPSEMIVAGRSWWTLDEEIGWTSNVTTANPTSERYLPANIYCVLFDPNDSQKFFVGTSSRVMRSTDRGNSFQSRHKGLESTVTYSVSAVGSTVNDRQEADNSIVTTQTDAVITGTLTNGVLFNKFYNANTPARQGFGQVYTVNKGRIAMSSLRPGGVIAQGTDGGLMRSLDFGATFERFYGAAISPQVTNLFVATGDSTNLFIDRSSASVEGGGLFNNPTPAQSVWALDEYLPAELMDREDLTADSLDKYAPSYIFFCSQEYVWLVNGAFESNLGKWNRLTASLVDGFDEYFTAMAVSGDENHNVFVATNKGKIWRLEGAHDLTTFDAIESITRIDNTPQSNLLALAGRTITDMAIDPLNPSRLVLTYGGYGGNPGSNTLVMITDSANNEAPTFGSIILRNNPDNFQREVTHTAEFGIRLVESNGVVTEESELFIGTEAHAYVLRGLDPEYVNLGGFEAPFYTQESDLSESNHWEELVLEEGTSAAAGVPVYDIFVRNLVSTVNTGVDELDGNDQILFDRDQTVYIATHGRGIWSTAALNETFRKGSDNEEIVEEEQLINLYPNPSEGIFSVSVVLDEVADVDLMMYGVDGRMVWSQRQTLKAGDHKLSVDAGNLSTGVYLMNVIIKGDEINQIKTLKAVITR